MKKNTFRLKFISLSGLKARPTRWQLKVLLAMMGFGIVAGLLLYTQILVDELIKREQRSIEFYANIYRYYTRQESAGTQDLFFLIEQITPTISFPIIMTDDRDVPNYPYSEYTLNIRLDTTKSQAEQQKYLTEFVQRMKASYSPIVIEAEGKILFKIYYTNSALITQLRYLPYFEIIIVAAFIMIGYVAFSYIKRSEQSNIWVGMAKEAAHQLGTPLSSLLAWIEILRLNSDDPRAVEDTVNEMEHDLERLNTIANRFSKIGSMPKKEWVNLAEVIENVCSYLERRLPNLGKKIEIRRSLDHDIEARISVELFKWVIENLLKNAAESIEGREGILTVLLRRNSQGKISIICQDNGKGMTKQVRRQVFNPGYTTKKRGWGLGLSLSKRIVEEYHGGRIFVKDSAPGKGTTFAIELQEGETRRENFRQEEIGTA